MSFFFTEEAQKKGNTKLLKIAERNGCLVCPLSKTDIKSPRMEPTSSNKPFIYVIGEAPGASEDREGKQFVGLSGAILRQELINIFGHNYEEVIRFNNTIRCWVGEENRTPEELEIECCKSSIIKDIENTKPLIIIGTGNIPLKCFTGFTKINLYRGRRIPIKVGTHVCWYFPILHPAYILRKRSKYGENEYDKVFRQDLENVYNFMLSKDYKEPLYIGKNYDVNIECVKIDSSNVKYLKTKLDELSLLPNIALDIETTGLKPYNGDKLLSVAIGDSSYIIAFNINNLSLPLLKDFLYNSGTKICHNLKFELEWLCYLFGNDLIHKTNWGDTFCLAYTLDERNSKQNSSLSLDSQCLINFGFNLKDLTNINRADLIHENIDKVLLYNGRDTKYTYLLYDYLYQQITDKLKNVYNNLIETTKSLAITQQLGVFVSKPELDKFRSTLDAQIKEIESKLFIKQEIKDYERQFGKFNPDSPQHVSKLLVEILKLDLDKKVSYSMEDYDANILIDDQLHLATDKAVLMAFAEEGIEICRLLLEYREATKLMRTYVKPMPKLIDNDGYLRTQFNQCYTATGRLCVAKGTLIETAGRVPIEDIKIGDFVYTYTDKGELTIRKVLWCGKTGIKKVIRLHWECRSDYKKGYLDVTPEHKIRLWDLTYIEAQNSSNKSVMCLSKYTGTDKFIPYNHIITHIEELDKEVEVYDIEVEETHNFIANEICVHNSSERPNLQNLPKRKNKHIRGIIVAPEGYKFVAADFSAIEYRVIAMASKDKRVCDAVINGYDPHKEWAIELIKLYPKFAKVTNIKELDNNPAKIKECRDIVKNKFVFPVIYGASAYKISEYLNIPTEIAKMLYDRFFALHYGIREYQEKVISTYNKCGYVESLFGRRRRAPISRNMIFNTGIQADASDIVVSSMNRLSKYALCNNLLKFQARLNIHDDLSFYLPISTLEEDIKFISKEMCKPCFDFINVPLGVEVSIGNSWGDLQEIGKFNTTQFTY